MRRNNELIFTLGSGMNCWKNRGNESGRLKRIWLVAGNRLLVPLHRPVSEDCERRQMLGDRRLVEGKENDSQPVVKLMGLLLLRDPVRVSPTISDTTDQRPMTISLLDLMLPHAPPHPLPAVRRLHLLQLPGDTCHQPQEE